MLPACSFLESQFVKKIAVPYYFEAPDKEEKTIIAHGHDREMYRFVEKTSGESHHEPKNRRKVTRIRLHGVRVDSALFVVFCMGGAQQDYLFVTDEYEKVVGVISGIDVVKKILELLSS